MYQGGGLGATAKFAAHATPHSTTQRRVQFSYAVFECIAHSLTSHTFFSVCCSKEKIPSLISEVNNDHVQIGNDGSVFGEIWYFTLKGWAQGINLFKFKFLIFVIFLSIKLISQYWHSHYYWGRILSCICLFSSCCGKVYSEEVRREKLSNGSAEFGRGLLVTATASFIHERCPMSSRSGAAV